MTDYISTIVLLQDIITAVDRPFLVAGYLHSDAFEGTLSAKSKRAYVTRCSNAVKRLRVLRVLYTETVSLETGYVLSAIADEALLIESLRAEVKIFDLRETRVWATVPA